MFAYVLERENFVHASKLPREEAEVEFRKKKGKREWQEQLYFKKVHFYCQNPPRHGHIQKAKRRVREGTSQSKQTLTPDMQDFLKAFVEVNRGECEQEPSKHTATGKVCWNKRSTLLHPIPGELHVSAAKLNADWLSGLVGECRGGWNGKCRIFLGTTGHYDLATGMNVYQNQPRLKWWWRVGKINSIPTEKAP